VDRVSGLSFAEFSRERIFEPLGLTSTQWRDDYRASCRSLLRLWPRGRRLPHRPSDRGRARQRRAADHRGDLLIWNVGDAVEPVAQSGSRGTADGGAGRNATFTPAPSALADYEGTYYSADAEATFVVEVVDGELTLKRRPAWVTTLRPQAEDTFASGVGTIRFIRDVSGAVTQLSVQQARVYDLRFDRR
jgi:CubicO group peptidase (beta-lactamase class C family)